MKQMTASLWNSVRGYVKIQMKGLSLERLLNLARREGLILWDVRRTGADCMTACVSVEDFRKMRFLQRSVRFRVHILGRKGLPFSLAGFRRRPVLLLGGAAMLCALWVCSLFVWEIRIEGCLFTDPAQVKEALATQGIMPGIRRKGVDPSVLSNRIVLDSSGIAWAGVTLEGGRLRVEIIEESAAPEFLDDNVPGDIVASKDALLASLDVFEGTAAVEEGQKVLQGELLVEGIQSGNGATGEIRQVRARADAAGRVWYTGRAQAAESVMEKGRTRRTEEAAAVSVGSMEASEPSAFAQYDVERSLSYSMEGFYLPFSIAKEIRYEVTEQPSTRTEEEMKRQAGEAAWASAAAKIPKEARIIDSKITYARTETGIEAVAVIETLEQIGRSVPRQEQEKTQTEETP